MWLRQRLNNINQQEHNTVYIWTTHFCDLVVTDAMWHSIFHLPYQCRRVALAVREIPLTDAGCIRESSCTLHWTGRKWPALDLVPSRWPGHVLRLTFILDTIYNCTTYLLPTTTHQACRRSRDCTADACSSSSSSSSRYGTKVVDRRIEK